MFFRICFGISAIGLALSVGVHVFVLLTAPPYPELPIYALFITAIPIFIVASLSIHSIANEHHVSIIPTIPQVWRIFRDLLSRCPRWGKVIFGAGAIYLIGESVAIWVAIFLMFPGELTSGQTVTLPLDHPFVQEFVARCILAMCVGIYSFSLATLSSVVNRPPEFEVN